MKKLLIVAAIAATASLAHAAAYTWGFTSGADVAPGLDPDIQGDDAYLAGGTAMLFLGTIAQTATGEGSGIDAKYSLDFTGLTRIATSGQDATYYDFGQTSFDPSVTSDLITEAGQAYTLILFEDTGVTDYENYEGKYYVYTGTSTKTQDPDSGTDFYDLSTGTAVAGDAWRTASPAAEPIPEPTSGLLVLLGMAGLALKRKKA